MAIAERVEHPMIREAMAYYDMRDELERTHLGNWVVISGGKVAGAHHSYPEALDGAKQLGLTILECCIKQVGAAEPDTLNFER